MMSEAEYRALDAAKHIEIGRFRSQRHGRRSQSSLSI
jgi:hypothetical protein